MTSNSEQQGLFKKLVMKSAGRFSDSLFTSSIAMTWSVFIMFVSGAMASFLGSYEFFIEEHDQDHGEEGDADEPEEKGREHGDHH